MRETSLQLRLLDWKKSGLKSSRISPSRKNVTLHHFILLVCKQTRVHIKCNDFYSKECVEN